MSKYYTRFGTWYSRKLDTHPVITRASTTGFITFLGDALCQKIEQQGERKKPNAVVKPFDWVRAGKFSSIGVVYIAPLLYLNYSILLPWLVPAKSSYATIKKLLVDQTVFASSMTAGFFILINLVEGNSVQKGIDDLRKKFWTTMLVNWQMWIPA